MKNNDLKMRFDKKRKKADAVASTLYGQTLNGHNSFYTIPCAFLWHGIYLKGIGRKI